MFVAEQRSLQLVVLSLPVSNILVKWNLLAGNLQSQILFNSNNVNFDVSCAIAVARRTLGYDKLCYKKLRWK